MSRNLMTPGEIRVANVLDNFFIGNKPQREKEDKPDYLTFIIWKNFRH